MTFLFHERRALNSQSSPPFWVGRSLVSECDNKTLLVLKFARTAACLKGLEEEMAWLHYLNRHDHTFPCSFAVPTPVLIDHAPLVQIQPLADLPYHPQPIHSDGYAACFICRHDYFHYINEQQSSSPQAPREIVDLFKRNSMLLGHLCGDGIIHTAPIPLFHNRIQRQRRDDAGVYDWTLGGRLDQWLASCRHPNFGHSGLRDFPGFRS